MIQILLCTLYVQETGSYQFLFTILTVLIKSAISANSTNQNHFSTRAQRVSYSRVQLGKKKIGTTLENLVCITTHEYLVRSIYFAVVCITASRHLQFQYTKDNSQESEPLEFKLRYFFQKQDKVLCGLCHASHEKALVWSPQLKAQPHYFWKIRKQSLDFGASRKVTANKPSNCSMKI